MHRLKLPEYLIPHDLKKVLDNNLEDYPDMSEKSQTFMKILKALKNVDFVNLSENHYLQLSKLALYLEEYQNRIDNKKKSRLIKKSITKCNGVDSFLYQISVNFDEGNKLRIKLQDSINVIDTTDNTSYTLRVTNVTETDIVVSDDNAKLSKTYTTHKLYNVHFRAQTDHNYPQRCAHYALSQIHAESTLTYLFPLKSKSFIKDNVINYGNMKSINPAIDDNPEQKQAVLSIINKSSFPAPYILYGPPGTGKTATLVEAMCQLHHDFPSSHILVCTPSNAAADEITKRLLKFISPEYIYRIYSQSKDGSTIDEDIRKCANYDKGKVVYANSEDIVKKRIVISTICNSMRLILMRIPKDHFSHLIIDEVGHGTEPDILIPISLISDNGKLHSQIVLAGDPQQLGPTITSKIATTILGRSILERLMSYDPYKKDFNNKYNSNYITKLLRNYRSHPNIIHISNKLFYDNELIPMSQESRANEMFPVIFHGVESKEEKLDFSPSSCNDIEIQLVMKYVDDLLNDRMQIGQVSAKDIGIVTPFALQSQMIQRILNNKNLKGINVGTVDLFQGQERKIMIMTTVRSKTFVHDGLEHIGFLSNSKRFNVAITRAKNLFIVIGNPNVLRIDDKWRMLLKFCVDNKSYEGLQLSSIHLSDDEDSTSKALRIVSSTILFGDEVSELFILHEHDVDLGFQDDYEHLIDVMRDLNFFDDIYDDHEEDFFLDVAENWDIDDNLNNDYEDFIEPEDLDDNEAIYNDPDDFVEPEDLDDNEEIYNDPDDFVEPEDLDAEEVYNDRNNLLESEELDIYQNVDHFDHFEPEEFEGFDDHDFIGCDVLVNMILESLDINHDYDYH